MAAAYTLDTLDLLVSERARGLGSALRTSAHALTTGAWWLHSGEPIAVALDLLVVLCLVLPGLIGGAFGMALGVAERHRAYWVPGLAGAVAAVNASRRSQWRR